MSGNLGSVGDDWLAVLTIFAPVLIPLIYAVGLWVVLRGGGEVKTGDDGR